jgi:hypothetical protein
MARDRRDREARKKERLQRNVERTDRKLGIADAMKERATTQPLGGVEPASTTVPSKREKRAFERDVRRAEKDFRKSGVTSADLPMGNVSPAMAESERRRANMEKLSADLQKVGGAINSILSNKIDPIKNTAVNTGANIDAQNTPLSGSALVTGVAKGGGTFNELTQAEEDAKVANQKEIEAKNELSQTTNALADELDKSKQTTPPAQEEVTVSATAPPPVKLTKPAETLPIPSADTARNAGIIPGDGGTLSQTVSTEPVRPELEQMITADQLRAEMMRRAADVNGNVPGAVLEALQTEDYYPNIRKDIAVGTYQGRYMGSATIFAAPGARVPLGLYDARKRALKEAAKEKQKQIDEILKIPDTSPQYQYLYNDYFIETLDGHLNRNNWNPDLLMRDMDYLRDMANMKAKAVEVKESVTFADAMLNAAADEKTYVPEEIRKNASDVKYAQVNDFDAIMRGDKNAVDIFRKAQIYKNLVPEVKNLAKDLLDPNRMGQSPINLRTGGKYDSEEWIKERNDFFQKIRDGVGYETFAEGVVKYFGGDYETMIENLVAGSGGSEDQIEPMKKMFASMIQQQVILDYETVNNDEVALMRERERQRQFNINREDRMNDFWGNINGGLNGNAPTDKNGNVIGVSYNDALLQAQSIRDPKKRKEKLAELSRVYGVGDVYIDPRTGAYVNSHTASPEAMNNDAKPKPLKDAQGNPTRTIPGEYYDKKSGKWIKFDFTPERLANTDKDVRIGGRVYRQKNPTDKEQLSAYGEVTGTVYTRTIGAETQKAYQKGDQIIYLKADGSNLEEYNASPNKLTLTTTVEKPYLRRSRFNEEKNQYEEYNVELPGQMISNPINISNRVDQQYLNNQWGYKPSMAAEHTFDEGDTYNYSGSSSSGGQ